MTQGHGTAGTAGRPNGTETNGSQALGMNPELGKWIYKAESKDRASCYLNTTDKIATYVGVKYGQDMKMLVKYGTEKVFTKPEPPEGTKIPQGKLEEYNTELTLYYK